MLFVVFIDRLTVSNALVHMSGGVQEKYYGLMRAGRRAKKRTGDGQTWAM